MSWRFALANLQLKVYIVTISRLITVSYVAQIQKLQ